MRHDQPGQATRNDKACQPEPVGPRLARSSAKFTAWMRAQNDIDLARHKALNADDPVVFGLLCGIHSCSRSSGMKVSAAPADAAGMKSQRYRPRAVFL
ncbi:hypothetical protein PSYMO_28986 [Pseudomonas amygdali pv. mori str. 301020]|uniref:Uncharacterized protein n=1 Tax=Pseudomonas amygdali pv. mori str. 301020 TaxID=629261 RepID=A0A656GIW9_PSEA0|nr:hypothetical protein PSYMO_28986 [Pseudomonas amygdali pv. mori str. 301020]